MMNHRRNRIQRAAATWLPAALTCILLAGCKAGPDASNAPSGGARKPAEPVITNRLAIEASVRQNLGITFVKVERRPVRGTLRVPGQFEFRPEARRDYHAMLAGRVELLVEQYQAIEAGDELFYMNSPEWHRMQHELGEAVAAIRTTEGKIRVADATKAEAEASLAFLQSRRQTLADVKVRQVELEGKLAELGPKITRLQAEIEAAHTDLDSAKSHLRVMLSTAAALTGVSVDDLTRLQPDRDEPTWRTLNQLIFRAEAGGIVDTVAITNGGWAETGTLLLNTVDPGAIRFHASAPQTDLLRFRDGQAVQIVPPQGGSIDLQDVLAGQLRVGFRGVATQRTIPLYVVPQERKDWARPGVSAFLEVFVAGSPQPVLAVPRRCVVRDGLVDVFFRRNPSNPNEVIRMEADLGASDGRWVAVASGVKEGDEIVLNGAYQLKLATSGQTTKGGHFCGDGTFHTESH